MTYLLACVFCDLKVSCREKHEYEYIELVLEALSATSGGQQFQNPFFPTK